MTEQTENLLGRRAKNLKTEDLGSRYANSPYFIGGVGEKAENSIDLPKAECDSEGKVLETEWETKALCGRFVELKRFTKKTGKVKEGAYYVLNQVDENGKEIEGEYLRLQAPGVLQKKVDRGDIKEGMYIEICYLGKERGNDENDNTEYHRFAVRTESGTTLAH